MKKHLLLFFISVVCLLTTQLQAQISISMTASKTNGVAPLGVFFDASSTTHNNGAIRPFHDLDFTWNFNDPASGNWSTSGLSKNAGKGGVSSHVFEQPGTYSVTLTVKDPGNAQATQQVVITVTDPSTMYSGTLTRCVSPTGDFTGAPAGAELITSNDFSAQTNWLFASNGPRRLLLHSGETYVCASSSLKSNRTGPYTLDSYGTGAKPIVRSNTSTVPIMLDSSAYDIRVMNVELDGQNSATAGHGLRPGRDMLVFKCNIKNHYNGISTSDLYGLKNKNIFSDNIFENNNDYNIYYNFGQHVAFVGNIFNKVVNGHLIRCYNTHSLIAHNQFTGGENNGITCVGTCGVQLKFVGYHPTGNPNRSPGNTTEAVEYGIISDNTFQEMNPFVYAIDMGPIDATKDMRIKDCIFERNIIQADSLTRRLLTLQGGIGITVRNNIFDFGDSRQIVAGIYIEQLGVEPPPSGHHVYNNTFYKSDSQRFVAVYIENVSVNTAVNNNLAVAPLTTDATLISGTGTNLIASNNIGYFPADPTACVNATGGNTCIDPMLVNLPGGNFHLQSGSPAIDAGINLTSVFEDFEGVARPQDGNGSSTAEWDIGAYEVAVGTVSVSQDNDVADGFSIAPNPNQGVFELIVSSGREDAFTIDIRNTIGQIIYTDGFSGRYAKRVDITTFGKGVYFITMKKNNVQLIKKIITY